MERRVNRDKYSVEIVLQGYNSSLTMLDSRNNTNNSNLVSENKSSLPNENMSQDPSDLDMKSILKIMEKIIDTNKSFKPIFVQDEMSSSHLSYAMSALK